MATKPDASYHDFKGLGFSKIGHFKEVRSKIKELEKLNIELAKRHNQLEAIFNSMSDGLTIINRDLDIVYANDVQRNRFPALIGKKCHAVFYGKNKICRNCPVRKTMETRETLRGEILIKDNDASGRYYEWTTTPIVDPFDRIYEVILLMRDITERKEYEFKLMQADRMATIGFLASGIAHEINNPLTSIAGFSEGLLKRLKNTPEFIGNKKLSSFRDYLEIIHSEAYRCKDIIRNIQRFSRKSTEEYEIISIDQLINETVSLVRQHAKDNKIKIVVKNNFPPGFNRIKGNESQLKHLFLILFSKAFETMEGGGELNISNQNAGNMIEIAIMDTGSSFPAQLSKSIFDPATMIQPIEAGIAVNLSICHCILRNHKCDVQFTKKNKNKEASLKLRFPSVLPE